MEYRINNTFDRVKPEGLAYVKTLLEEKNRRFFGESAVGLKNQLKDPKYKDFEINKKAVEIGISGEMSTSKALKKWISDKQNVVLIESIQLPLQENRKEEELDEEEGSVQSLGDTDHLLIIGNHIIIIDSKNWKERATYSINDDGFILRNKKSFSGGRPKAKQTRFLWEKYFQGESVETECYVCVANENSNIVRDRNWWKVGVRDFKLVNQKSLIEDFLDKEYEKTYKDIDYFNVDLIAMALKGLQKPYNEFADKFPTFYKVVRK